MIYFVSAVLVIWLAVDVWILANPAYIAVGMAMIALSSRAGFEFIHWLVEICKQIDKVMQWF